MDTVRWKTSAFGALFGLIGGIGLCIGYSLSFGLISAYGESQSLASAVWLGLYIGLTGVFFAALPSALLGAITGVTIVALLLSNFAHNTRVDPGVIGLAVTATITCILIVGAAAMLPTIATAEMARFFAPAIVVYLLAGFLLSRHFQRRISRTIGLWL